MPHALIFALSASILSLVAAFIAQYGFDFRPCELCLIQRVPYALVIALALAGLMMPSYRKLMAYMAVLLFAVGGGIASYHAAVEQHWVKGPSACTSSPSPAGQSLDDLLQKIKNAPAVACDQPPFAFHGITMAGMNAAWSFLLTAATLIIIRRTGNGQAAG